MDPPSPSGAESVVSTFQEKPEYPPPGTDDPPEQGGGGIS